MKKVRDVWISRDTLGVCIWNLEPTWDEDSKWYKLEDKRESDIGWPIPPKISKYLKTLKMNTCVRVKL